MNARPFTPPKPRSLPPPPQLPPSLIGSSSNTNSVDGRSPTRVSLPPPPTFRPVASSSGSTSKGTLPPPPIMSHRMSTQPSQPTVEDPLMSNTVELSVTGPSPASSQPPQPQLQHQSQSTQSTPPSMPTIETAPPTPQEPVVIPMTGVVSNTNRPKIDLRSYHALLAQRHSSLPILVVASESASIQFAPDLAALFQSAADSLISSVVLQQLGRSKVIDPSEIVSPVPFRSISRTIQLEVNADQYYTKDGSMHILQMANMLQAGTHHDQRASVSLRFSTKAQMDHLRDADTNADKTAEQTLLDAASTIASDCIFNPNQDSSIDHSHGDMTLMELTELVQRLQVHWMKRQVHAKRVRAGLAEPRNNNTANDDDPTDDSNDSDLLHLAAALDDSSITSTASSTNVREMQRHAFLARLTGNPFLPFMKHCRHVLDTATDFSIHEMVHCPLLHLLVASSTDNYITVLSELSNSIHHLPKSYQNGQFDPSDVSFGHGGAKRYMLLLHDAHLFAQKRPNDDFVESTVLKRMQQAFPSFECVVLKLNTAPDHTLSLEDHRTIRTFVVSLLRDGCIPTMERRVFYLNAVVSNAKKGVKNVFKSFWRKPKNSDSGLGQLLGNSVHGMSSHGLNTSNHNSWDNLVFSSHGSDDVPYKFDSIESQTRLLADSLFLMKDYESALSCYRLVKDDFKADKAMVYYASVQEMMALCLYQMDSGLGMSMHSDRQLGGSNGGPYRTKYGREAYHAMENALYSYTRAADEERLAKSTSTTQPNTYPARPQTAVISTRLATRLCLIMSAASPIPTGTNSLPSAQSLASSRLLDLADLLASASSHETPLGAAVLLEQASRHYLGAMHYKKYSFHMLMSGHMYRSCRQERHAARCFAAALYMYQQSHWNELLDHLESALAQQFYSCEYYSLSLLLYLQLMDSETVGKISSKGLHKFWNHVLEICKTHPSEAQVGARLLRQVLHHTDLRTTSLELDVATSTSINNFTATEQVLELCHLDLPRVLDSSIQVLDMTTVIQNETFSSEWSELNDYMEAELRASRSNPVVTTDEVLSQLRNIESEKVISRRSKATDKTVTRACCEPVLVQVDISNPLNVDLELHSIQLVAELNGPDGLGTNQHPTMTVHDTNQTFSFHACPTRNFSCPDSYSGTDSPYFCVEKQSLTLEPSASTTISLAICPLVEGEFKILGLRAKLYGQVWMYHLFFLQGPLLQDTRAHRANRVRAPNRLLTSNVSIELPLLKVEPHFDHVVDDTNTHCLIQGQVMRGTLKLDNLGRAPTRNIFIKTSAPWLRLLSSTETAHDQATSFTVGPTGTLMRLPLERTLEPGQADNVPFEILARGVGRQEYYMLFSYDLLNPSDATQRRWITRTCRCKISVSVFPSMTVTASLAPSFWAGKNNVLSLELTNYRSDRRDQLEMVLSQICVASRYYEAVPIEGQIEDTDDSVIGWQERLTLHYILVPQTNGCQLSSFAFDKGECSQKADVVAFACLEHAHNQFKSDVKMYKAEQARLEAMNEADKGPRSIAQIRRGNQAKNQSSNEMSVLDASMEGYASSSLAALCPPDPVFSTVNLICKWKALDCNSNEAINGQHSLLALFVRPQHRGLGCPLTVTSQYKSHVIHDFAMGDVEVPMEVTIVNRLLSGFRDSSHDSLNDVEFEFEILAPPTFKVVGTTTFRFTLRGGDDISVPLVVLIPNPGVHNLQCIRIFIYETSDSTGTKVKVPYLFPVQWLCRVSDSKHSLN